MLCWGFCGTRVAAGAEGADPSSWILGCSELVWSFLSVQNPESRLGKEQPAVPAWPGTAAVALRAALGWQGWVLLCGIRGCERGKSCWRHRPALVPGAGEPGHCRELSWQEQLGWR